MISICLNLQLHFILLNHVKWLTNCIFQLRNHPSPYQSQFEDLRLCGNILGIDINTDTNKTLAESLDKCEQVVNSDLNKVSKIKHY